MKIGVIGKGGSGKTTVSGVLARSLARQGWEVVAIDCDSNPNLGISLGLGLDQTQELAAIRQALDEGTEEHAPTAEEVLQKFGSVGPDRVRVAVVTRIDKPSGGCPCCGISPEQLLAELETGELPPTAGNGTAGAAGPVAQNGSAPARPGRVLIADMEAGLGTIGRMREGSLDVAILVTEPTPKAIEVVRRAAEMVVEHKIATRTVILANKVRDESDVERVSSVMLAVNGLAGVEVIVVPEDLDVLAADAQGVSPIDHAPDSPAVEAVAAMAERLAA
ncbi:MAG: AAA family ATPase [Candidatus Dormibacteraeota bacterium]|nr:AAA family ATPase [Candidatus Dormibacteraeota bacterium]